MKIKFLAFSYTKPYSFNPIYYWLKSFYKMNGKSFDEYEWLPTEYFYADDIVDTIIDEGTNILCLSVYLWNFESLMKVAREAKEINPKLCVIVGGPECHANTESNWFHKYDFVDFAVYGDGESSFCKLLDWMIDSKDISLNSIPNLITPDHMNPHEILKFNQYESYSPYLDLSDEFLFDYKSFKDTVNGDFVYLPYERTRGCMYSCAFCDWQSGLHYKVNRRINDYKLEIDFFAENQIRSMHIDANVGMFKEDVELYEYVYGQMKKHDLEFIPTEPRNMAKLNKERVALIYDILCNASPKYNVKVSLQAIYKDVLANINRPDVPWIDHKKIILKTKADHPEIAVIPELIMGLPGMTYDRINETHLEFADIPMTNIYAYEWILLKKAPAYSKAYRDKHNLTVTKTFYPAIFTGLNSGTIDYDDFAKDPNICINKNQAYFIDMVYDKTLGVKGVIYNKIITRAYNRFVRDPIFGREWFSKYLTKHFDYFMNVAESEAVKQEEYFEKYGFYIWGNCDIIYNTIGNYEIGLDTHIDRTNNDRL